MKRLLQLTLVLFITAGLTTIASAQPNTAQIKGVANVQASINVSPVQALNFGTITQGNTSNVLVGDNNAGQFKVSGNSGYLTLDISFANGGKLLDVDGVGQTGAPITINNLDADWGPDATTQKGENWDPTTNNKTGINLAGATNSEIYVFIGGSITAATNQAPGLYEETITLTATHN